MRGCVGERLTLPGSRTQQDARLAKQASAFLTKYSLQLVLICNSIRNTLLEPSITEIILRRILVQWQAPQLLAGSGQQTTVSVITAMPSLTLLEGGVKLFEVENFGSSTEGFCACTIHSFHCILNLHDTLTSPVSHPQVENHQMAQLVHCQNKKSRTVEFKTKSVSKGLGLSIYSLVSEKSSTACHARHLGTGHPKSFSTSARSSLFGREKSLTGHSAPPPFHAAHATNPWTTRCIEISQCSSTAFCCIFIKERITR